MRKASRATKRLSILVLSVVLALLVALIAATIGLGQADVPDGAVAVVESVEDGEISEERFQRSLEQTAARLGLEEVPAEDDPQFGQLRDEAVQGLLLATWVEGEIDERDIEVSDSDVEAELEQIQEGFENEKQFSRAVRQAKFCTETEIEDDVAAIECEDVQRQARLIAVQRALVDEIDTEPEVSDDDVEDFYEQNIESFVQPATRDVRQILNENEAKVQQAKDRLEGISPDDPDYKKTWRQVAKELSQDQASKDRGGLLEGLVEGQNEPSFDEQVFTAEQGELIGPFETDRGFFLVQVTEINEENTQSLEEASEAVRAQLQSVRAQSAQTRFQDSFAAKWRSRTVCAPIALTASCENFEPEDPPEVPGQETPEPAPVQSTRPIAPGTAAFSIDGSPQTGLVQRPRQLGDPCAPEGATPDPCGPDDAQPGGAGIEGALPIGPDGAPGAPGAPGGQP